MISNLGSAEARMGLQLEMDHRPAGSAVRSLQTAGAHLHQEQWAELPEQHVCTSSSGFSGVQGKGASWAPLGCKAL